MIRKNILPFILVALIGATGAEAKVISGLKAGTLADAAIASAETELTISGEMNAADFFYIFDNLASLRTLDLGKVTVVAYRGDVLPYTGMSASEAGKLPAYALTGLTNLREIKLPAGLKTIGKGALSGSGITSLVIPPSVNTIEDYAFMRCPNLRNVSMSSGVTSIGTRAFAYCPQLDNVVLSDALTVIPEGLFEACGGLQSLDLEALGKCDEIGPWALAQCNGLTTLVLPSGASAIGKCAMYGTSMIETLVVPADVAEIGDGAMGAMSALNLLRVDKVTSVPDLGRNVWSQVGQPDVKLVTPDSQVDDYKNAEQWKNFNIVSVSQWQSATENIESAVGEGGIQVGVSGGVLTVSGGDRLGTVSIYDVAGKQVASKSGDNRVGFDVEGWTPGVYLIVSGIGVAKVSVQ